MMRWNILLAYVPQFVADLVDAMRGPDLWYCIMLTSCSVHDAAGYRCAQPAGIDD